MDGGLVSLFFGSLLASTLVPAGVEGLLYLQVESGGYRWYSLLIVASIGNTLGGVMTWWIGRILKQRLVASGSSDSRLARWFALKPAALQRVQKWGAPALLLSWVPVIGDPLCLAGGFLGMRWWPSFIMIAVGKVCRYIVLLWLLYSTVA